MQLSRALSRFLCSAGTGFVCAGGVDETTPSSHLHGSLVVSIYYRVSVQLSKTYVVGFKGEPLLTSHSVER